MTDAFPIIIPDELLAWGNLPEVSLRFARPWAREIEEIASKAPLGVGDLQRLMNRLEALCVEAIRAERTELLSGLDTRTAERIGLSYSFETGAGRRVEIGAGKRYTWAEMRAVLATDAPKEAIAFVEQAKDLLAEAFPEARISAVSDTASEEAAPCASCGSTDCQVMMTTVHGTQHCGSCWVSLTDTTPMTYQRKGKRR